MGAKTAIPKKRQIHVEILAHFFMKNFNWCTDVFEDELK
jgi:hypothetical protein